MTKDPALSPADKGLLFGFLGVLGFSLTLPATRWAVAELDPTVVGLGRALVAAVLAAGVLAFRREEAPLRHWRSLTVVAAGVVLGFPLLSTWAMRRVPASHGAVVTGLLPLATVAAAAWRAGERPSALFWASTVAGSLGVALYALAAGGGRWVPADAALLIAVLGAGLGYAEGGRLAKTLGGERVICWALVLAAPFLVLPVGLAAARHGLAASPKAWMGFAYLSVVSMFLAFFAWYRGLATGGIARVGRVQLLQPFLTLLASAAFLGEKVSPATLGAALLVLVTVGVGRAVPVPAATTGLR
jgi:drug/metabolite transporter (DMT)-like permease